VEQFDRKDSFTIWQWRVKDILIQWGLTQTLQGKDSKPKEEMGGFGIEMRQHH